MVGKKSIRSEYVPRLYFTDPQGQIVDHPDFISPVEGFPRFIYNLEDLVKAMKTAIQLQKERASASSPAPEKVDI